MDWLGLMKEIADFHCKFAGERAEHPLASQSKGGDDLSGNSSSTNQKSE